MKTLNIEHEFILPPDDWFHIAPLGEFDHASGLRQVIDGKACTAMAENFSKESNDPNFPGLLVDFDHFSHSPEKSSTAAGWITALKTVEPACERAAANRKPNDTPPQKGGLWAKIRWSDLGNEAVRGGRYRLVSPVWNRSDCEPVEKTGKGEKARVRPLRLARVALTNDPNLKGLVPLTNRIDPESGSQKEQSNTMDYRSKLIELLGLDANASDEQIAAACASSAEQQDSLQQRYKALLATRVEDDLREFACVIGDVDAVRGQLLGNRDGTLQVLKALRKPEEISPRHNGTPAPVVVPAPLHNRATARVPETVFSSERNPTEEARARRIANRAREIQKQLGVGHTQAFEMARGELAKN